MPNEFEKFYDRVCHALGIRSQQELARMLGVNRSAITQAKQRDAVPDKWILRLTREYGLDPAWLEQGDVGTARSSFFPEQQTNYFEVPKVGARLCAGGGSFDVDSEVIDTQVFQRPWLDRKGRPDEMVLMDVFGDSMEPEIKAGDTVLIDQSQKNVLAGAIYAVGVEDTVMVKRLEKRPNALVLLSDNRAYSPIMLQGDELETVRVIGKIVWICREYR